jgi:curved DNA-binding protein CbpA
MISIEGRHGKRLRGNWKPQGVIREGVIFVVKKASTVSKRDYYEILNVARNASAAQIRAAHRVQSRRYHPDTADDGQGDPVVFAQVQEAYETLAVADLRRRYDHKPAAAQMPGRGTRRPPKAPCGACKKKVFASQLTLYLGRYICKTCYDRKLARDAKRPQLTGMVELRWRLKRLGVWAQSHFATILVIVAAMGAAGARVAWMSHRTRPPAPADSVRQSANHSSTGANSSVAAPVTASESAEDDSANATAK